MTYLNDLYRNVDTGAIGVFLQKSKSLRFFDVSNLDDAAAYMLAVAPHDTVYHTFNIYAKNATTRAGSNVIGMPGCMVDLDIVSDDPSVHSKNDCLPPSEEAILSFIGDEIGLPPFTALLNSGNGRYGVIQFDTPLLFSSDDERKEASDYVKRYQGIIRKMAHSLKGWHVDATGDLARITRMPGTYNHKTTPPKEVTLSWYHPDARLPFKAFKSAVEAAEAKYSPPRNPAPARSRAREPATADKANSAGPAPRYESVAAGCEWINTLEKSDRISEPEWYASASIIGRCEDGETIFHEISSKDSRYDATETAEKLARALEVNPRTCDNVHNELGFAACADCPFFGLTRSPIKLGHRDPEMVRIMKNHVIDLSTDTYISLETNVRYRISSMNSKYRHILQSPHSNLSADDCMRKVEGVEYIPGVTQRFVMQPDGMKLNTWRPSLVVPERGDCSLITDHLRYVMGDAAAEHFLNALAYIIQHPGKKIRHAFVIGGKQGTGKSFIGALLSELLGAHNVRTINASTIVSRWNVNLCGCQCLIAEELSISDKHEGYEQIKTLITQDRIMVEEKGIPMFFANTPHLIVALTNHDVPIRLPEDDRRFFVTYVDSSPRSAEYYDTLFHSGLRQASAFLHFLLIRDVQSFSPDAHPPLTEAKKALIDASRPQIEQAVLQMIDDYSYPLHRDVVAAVDLVPYIASRVGNIRVTEQTVARALGRLGCVNAGQIRLSPTDRVRGWIVRNAEQWMTASLDALKDEYLRKQT